MKPEIKRVIKVKTELEKLLPKCDELWIASAIVTDSSINFLQNQLRDGVKQHYLIGIDLPTPASALKKLLDLSKSDDIDFGVYYKKGQIFHPKVYLFRVADKLILIIGSANFTNGGITTNIEMSILSNDQELAENILEWFNTYMRLSYDIDIDFISDYELLSDKRHAEKIESESDLRDLFAEIDGEDIDLEKMNFENQFFQRKHYEAFTGTKPSNESQEIDKEREDVRSKLYDLHEELIPIIKNKKWQLFPHYEFINIVSSSSHSLYTGRRLSAIWLHYGRGKKEIKNYGKKQTPIDYMRMQVIILKDRLGVWNRVGKDQGSRIDREYFKESMYSDADYRGRFYQLIEKLPDSYFIEICGERVNADEFKSPEELHDFVKNDNLNSYFEIGIEYSPDDTLISDDNIVETIITDFEYLYPIYKHMKHELNY